MSRLDEIIVSVEKKWLNKLSEFCQNHFSKIQIPSHDYSHHLRVWQYSKEIIYAINTLKLIDKDFIESCLIASLFHDTGLTQTLNENHGHESRKICERYFKNNQIKKPNNFEEILSAIELHDDKNYINANQDPNSIISVLCNADDLDAFGKIGVIRYTEIYFMRGISLIELPKAVIQNLDKRFANFKNSFQMLPELFEKHKQRYLITKRFFEELLEDEL